MLCASGGIHQSGPRGGCGIPRVPIRTYSMHGGAGAILSVGLLRAISLESFQDCVRPPCASCLPLCEPSRCSCCHLCPSFSKTPSGHWPCTRCSQGALACQVYGVQARPA